MEGPERMLADIHREVAYTRSLTGMEEFSERVYQAMASVPRHKFVPEHLVERAYDNNPLPIGYGQTISQPYIVALIAELLETEADDVVLEVGTGSGYQAAVISRLVKQVYTTEIVPQLAEQARERLVNLGYDNIEVSAADGYYGLTEHAPYDGIIVTAAAPVVPRALVEQLAVGARLILPVGQPFSYQELVMVEKEDEERLKTRHILGVSFVPLTGKH